MIFSHWQWTVAGIKRKNYISLRNYLQTIRKYPAPKNWKPRFTFPLSYWGNFMKRNIILTMSKTTWQYSGLKKLLVNKIWSWTIQMKPLHFRHWRLIIWALKMDFWVDGFLNGSLKACSFIKIRSQQRTHFFTERLR